MESWYWHKENENFRRGPIDKKELIELYSSGKLNLKDRVWIEGFTDWMDASDISFIRSIPPPIKKPKSLLLQSDETKLSVNALSSNKQIKVPHKKIDGVAIKNEPHKLEVHDHNENLKGIGGWLLIFCIFAAILTPLASVRNIVSGFGAFNTHVELEPLFASIILLEVILAICVVIFGIIVGILIWNSHHNGKMLAIQYLVLRLSTALLVSLAFIITDLSQEMDLMSFQGIFLTLMIEFLTFIAWYSYFINSKRVENTFGHEEWGTG